MDEFFEWPVMHWIWNLTATHRLQFPERKKFETLLQVRKLAVIFENFEFCSLATQLQNWLKGVKLKRYFLRCYTLWKINVSFCDLFFWFRSTTSRKKKIFFSWIVGRWKFEPKRSSLLSLSQFNWFIYSFNWFRKKIKNFGIEKTNDLTHLPHSTFSSHSKCCSGCSL